MGSGNRFAIFALTILVVVATSAATTYFMKSSAIDDDILVKKISAFVLENPEVIANSIRRAQQIERERLDRETQKTVKKKITEIEEDPLTPVTGNPDATVTIVEFFDYNCGYCKRVGPDLARLVKEFDNVKVVLKELPILGEPSQKASEIAMAAWLVDKEKYFDLHLNLLKMGARTDVALSKAAKAAGFNIVELKEKGKSEEVQNQLKKHRELAGAIGVSGTPSFVVNGVIQRGALDYKAMKELVSKAN